MKQLPHSLDTLSGRLSLLGKKVSFPNTFFSGKVMLWNSELSWPASSSASEAYTSVTLYKHTTIHLPTRLIIDIIDTSSSGILNNTATPLLFRLLLCVAWGFLQDKPLEIKLLSRRAGIFKTLPSATNTPYQLLLLVVHESEGFPPPSPTPSIINLFNIYHSSIISVTAVMSRTVQRVRKLT